jgi:hypothetical protein
MRRSRAKASKTIREASNADEIVIVLSSTEGVRGRADGMGIERGEWGAGYGEVDATAGRCRDIADALPSAAVTLTMIYMRPSSPAAQ